MTNWQQWGSHSGYFDDYAFYQRWCHTTLWGAGVWHTVNEFNGIEFDESRIRTTRDISVAAENCGTYEMKLDPSDFLYDDP